MHIDLFMNLVPSRALVSRKVDMLHMFIKKCVTFVKKLGSAARFPQELFGSIWCFRILSAKKEDMLLPIFEKLSSWVQFGFSNFSIPN